MERGYDFQNLEAIREMSVEWLPLESKGRHVLFHGVETTIYLPSEQISRVTRETSEHEPTTDVLQDAQKVDLVFHGIDWPHLAVNTLIKQP